MAKKKKKKEPTLCSWCSKVIKGQPVLYNGEFICIKCWATARERDHVARKK